MGQRMNKLPPSPTPPAPPRPPAVPARRPAGRGGGVFIAAGVVLGTAAGVGVGQPSIGLIGGFVAGCLAALALVLADRRR
jgi:hypothetical protein